MRRQPNLSDQEWELLLQLLKSERRELPAMIHHSDTRTARHDLSNRLHMIEDLIGRLGTQQADA